jgi:hypothetical protein
VASRRGFFAPIHEGVFSHRKRIGSAFWEFALLINWVSKEQPDPDLPGESLGLVLGGKPIPLRKIADSLDESVEAAKEHLQRLEAEGYIVRERAVGGSYSYMVKRSKKWSCKSESCSAPEVTQVEGVEGKLPRGSGVNAPEGQGQMPLSYKEENKISNREQKTSSSTSKKKPSGDPRFQPFVDVVDGYWKRKNPAIKEWFTKGFGANLKQVLSDNPSLTVETFESWVSNRENSEPSPRVNHSKSPHRWILDIKDFASGPFNGYGSPVTTKGNGNGKANRAQGVAATEWAGFESIARAAAGIAADGRADGRGAGDVPQATID